METQNKLDALDIKIIESYLKLPPEGKKAIKNYLISVDANIDMKVDNFRKELEAEQKGGNITSFTKFKRNRNLRLSTKDACLKG